jgi:hypothetical protein
MDTLASFPFVIVRIGCEGCTRQGAYRLARLAAKYGAEIAMPDLLAKLAADCLWMNPRHPYAGRCQARFVDLDGPRRPPDSPARRLRVVRGGRG